MAMHPPRLRYSPLVDPETREELEATVAARRELGASHESELVEGFVERLERRLGDRSGERPSTVEAARMRFVLGLVSLGTGIPISAIAASQAGLLGLAVAWGGIVGVNAAFRR